MGDHPPCFYSLSEKEIDLSLLNSITEPGRHSHGAYVPLILFCNALYHIITELASRWSCCTIRKVEENQKSRYTGVVTAPYEPGMRVGCTARRRSLH